MSTPVVVRSSERGMSLPELLVGMIIMGVVGAALVRLLLVQNRFFDKQLVLRSARSASRGAVNVMLSDLRMVDASGGLLDTLGLASAAPRTLTVRVPYAMGIACNNAGSVIVTLVPLDTMLLNQAAFSGFAWRDTLQGKYHYVESGAAIAPSSSASCQAGFTTIPGARVVALTPVPAPSVLPGGGGSLAVGTPVMVHQQIRYELKASTAFAGKVGLWRTLVRTGSTEEIAAPFDTSAVFKFYVGNADTSQAAAPALLSTVRGIDFVFNAVSPRAAQGSTATTRVPTTTAVFFKNRLN
jgi:prepilin-type N-terminal cleavage/methylation domain-containing protein